MQILISMLYKLRIAVSQAAKNLVSVETNFISGSITQPWPLHLEANGLIFMEFYFYTNANEAIWFEELSYTITYI